MVDNERKVMRKVVARVLSTLEGGSGLHELLQGVQQALGYIPAAAIGLVAERTALPASHVFEAVCLDDSFALLPPGRHRVAICRGERCSTRGGLELAQQARELLGIRDYGTTADHAIRLEPFYCFDACEDGPNVRADGVIHGQMNAPRLAQLLKQLREG